MVHYASLSELDGVEEFVDKYKKETDFHNLVAKMANIPRSTAKTINLGLFYGMGKGKLMDELNLNKIEAEELFEQYHSRVPFVRQLATSVSKKASETGVVRTLLGRRCRFPLWEPAAFGIHKPMSYEDARREYGPGIRRAFTYKALNKLIQGSGSDMTKKAMVSLAKKNITSMLQVHDELAISVEENDLEKKIKKIKKIMEECVKLKVPNKVDVAIGNNWGTCK